MSSKIVKSYTAEELAKILKAEIVGNKNTSITGIAALEKANENDISFLTEKKYFKKIFTTKASILIVAKNFTEKLPEDKTLLKCEIPNFAFSTVVKLFAPPAIKYPVGVNPTAYVAESAVVDPSCHIGANAVVGEDSVIGKNSKICAGAVICENVTIGENCLIYPCAVVRDYSEIGNNVVINPNATIGGDGFGFTPTPYGIIKVPQVGIVKIEDDVEIGANSTVNRARFGKTWIKTGVKIDDQVAVGHNTVVGEYTMLVAQCGIAGSVNIGQGVIVAGKAAVNGHIEVGDGARIGPCCVVKNDVKPGEELLGYPAESPRDFLAHITVVKSQKKLKNKVKELEKIVNALNEKLNLK